ncbi:transposase, partial [Candidatus Frackibacter sp. WG13]
DKDRYLRDIYRNRMKTDEFIELTNQRAGVEGLPSVFRRFYNVDSMPVRGKVRSKLFFGFKVLASNVKKLFKNPGIVTG